MATQHIAQRHNEADQMYTEYHSIVKFEMQKNA